MTWNSSSDHEKLAVLKCKEDKFTFCYIFINEPIVTRCRHKYMCASRLSIISILSKNTGSSLFTCGGGINKIPPLSDVEEVHNY